MEARELRIGNYYNNNGDIMEVTPNTILEVWESQRIWCKPIIITEQWLIKLGFTGVDGSYFYKKIGEFNEINIDLEDNAVRHDSHWICDLKYVHQLQNLYFSLTGEELTLQDA